MNRPLLNKFSLFDLVVIIIAFLILADWNLHIGIFNWMKNGLLMSPETAITFIIAGVSKSLFEHADANKKLLIPAKILALYISFIGSIRILTIVFGFAVSEYTMDLVTAFSFVLTGSALYYITVNNAEKIFFPHLLSLITFFIAFLSSVTLIFNRHAFYGIETYQPMRMITSINFMLLSFSILLVNKRKGFMGEITSEYAGGKIARLFLPMALAIPVIISFFRFKNEETGLFSSPYGIAFITLARIIILVFFIWKSAVIINRSSKALIAEIEERKKTEENLRYRKALLEAQNEAIPDAILVVDTKGQILSYNNNFGKLWGIPQNIINERDDTAALKFAMTQLVDPNGFIHRVNYIYAHPDTTAHDEILFNDGRIIERYGNVVKGEDGKKYGWAWYFRDITQTRNYEKKIENFNKDLEIKVEERTEQLYKSEKRFRSLIENAEDIISLSDENGIRFYISPAIEKLTGYSIQETINQPVFNIVHPDDIEQSRKMRFEYMQDPGVIKPMSFRFLHKNGGFVWMEGTLINLLHDENVKAVVGNFHDVSERKKSDEKIRIANERLEMVSRATNDAVWDWNLETDEIYWNEEIRSMFGYYVEDIPTGSEWKVHIHPEDFKRVTKKLVYHIKNGIQNWQDEYRFRCADGTYKFVFNRGFILFNDNKPYRIIGAMQDVTEINKLQQSLNDERIKRQKELTNANIQGQEKERTEIGRELHDNINQLLTAIKLYLNVAASQPSMKDEMIKRSLENLSKCIEEIRKLSTSLVPPSIDAVSFAEIIKDLAEPIKFATAINITYKIDDTHTNALSDNQQLNVYRIIQEHLNNILKHAQAKNISINIQHEENQIVLSIKDDGQGFDITARRKGIGLKNIQSRAELLNGKMNVISKPGKGCLLVVNFPVAHSDD